MLDVTGYLKLD